MLKAKAAASGKRGTPFSPAAAAKPT